jgi:plastocyanin
MGESRRQDAERRATGRVFRAGARPLLAAIVVLLGAGCGGGAHVATGPPVSAALARVDTSTVTESDFDAALTQWHSTDSPDPTASQWRRWLQLLIDWQLLIREARELGFYDDPALVRELETWERSQMIAELIETDAVGRYTDEELHEFYYGTGANRDILVGRLAFDDEASAAAGLAQVREHMSFAQLVHTHAAGSRHTFVDSIWLNRLTISDKLKPLTLKWVGDAEMFLHKDHYLVAVILDERSVPLEDRRSAAEQALTRERQEQANPAYLASLVQNYDVSVDSVTLGRLQGTAAADSANGHLSLVHSSLGDWTAGQYWAAVARLSPGQGPFSGSFSEWKLRVQRTYAVDQLFAKEVEAKGLAPEFARRRRAKREQKAVDALREEKGLTQVSVTQMELRRYLEANQDRYGGEFSGLTAEARIHATALRDLKHELAAPLLDDYVAGLRRRHRHEVSVDTALFRAYIQRKTANPSSLTALNGCDPFSAVDATGKSEVRILFGGALGYAYEPACLAVSVGTTVTFAGDFAAHPLMPGRIEAGEVIAGHTSPLTPTAGGLEVKFPMTRTGAFGYFCDRHVADAMVGAIFVE